MEQNNQKIPLPIKTKVAAWWIIILGALLIIPVLLIAQYIFFRLIPELQTITHLVGFLLLGLFIFLAILTIILFILSISNFILGFYLFKGKKGAWRISIILLIVEAIIFVGGWIYYSGLVYYGSILILLFLPPILLLYDDRKNFFKTAS